MLERKDEIIDQSYLDFKIPSARDLYEEIVNRDEFYLLTRLTLENIKDRLHNNGLKFDNYFESESHIQVTNSIYFYTFHLKKSHTRNEYLSRRKVLDQLKKMRYEFLSAEKLMLDADTPVYLHFSDTEKFGFNEHEKKGVYNDYRALCIHDFIIDRFYHLLKPKGEAYKDNLIANYLMVHSKKYQEVKTNQDPMELLHNSSEYLKFKSYRSEEMEVFHKIIHCLKYKTFNSKAAELLKHALNETVEVSTRKNEFNSIPLTPEAYLDDNYSEKVNENHFGLTKYSHYYFSLIQYRYLLDLKCIAFENDKKFDIKALESKKLNVDIHMKKWNEFKSQSNIIKCESLVTRVKNLIIKQNFPQGMCNSAYWEEFTKINGEKGILIGALNTSVETRLFTQSFAMKIQDELQLISKGILNPLKMNPYPKSDTNHAESYYLFINETDLVKCPVDYLLAHHDHIIKAFKDITLTKKILSNLSFFQTKTSEKWRQFLTDKHMLNNDMNSFIWNLAAASKMKEWIYNEKDKNILPLDIFSIIIYIHGRLLEQDNLKLKNKF